MAETQHLTRVVLDEKSVLRRKPEVEQERAIAIQDLLDENYFLPLCKGAREPFGLILSLDGDRLVFDIRDDDDTPLLTVPLPLLSFRRLIKDYFIICESYFAAIKTASPAKIEAIDMGRRGLHNEGATLLQDLLSESVEVDLNTARRLFTLVCVLHLRG